MDLAGNKAANPVEKISQTPWFADYHDDFAGSTQRSAESSGVVEMAPMGN